MSQHRIKVRSIILALTGILITVLALRVTLDLVRADSENVFVTTIESISDPLIDPFLGIIEVSSDSGLSDLNIDAIFAILVFALLGIAVSKIVTSFMYDDISDIIINFIDAIFKVVEFLILLRIVFYFFKILPPSLSSFVKTTYDLTEWTQFVGIKPDILPDRLDWSAIIVLVIIVILDLITENILQGFFKGALESYKKVVVKRNTPKPIQQYPANIIVNVPSPVMQTPPQNVHVTNYVPTQPSR